MSDSANTDLDPVVKEQLLDFVMRISSMYRENPFHSFEHASHVTMSASKLLGRLLRTKRFSSEDKKEADIARELHNATCGISSDPLMQFSLVLAALIHDVDHSGLPNSVLVSSKTPSGKSGHSLVIGFCEFASTHHYLVPLLSP